ncbi:hypothetical protein AKJ48_03825 [candidate division MSBL1 archaeon SCGC-AAA261O19]|uniref:Ribbon-helix-helix protein CopG domain-containing protein n=1 Tax=candidate division MSBL1 archaeon SCGC-AAA261O19 TaxID=1698277 RepID=A0A133VAP7_9EURY|nr:hypothetical protein AKJ48_03825 [candidate division MSBL1 archaeon SCGC-AAA261O19]
METITARIPKDLLQDLKEIESEEKTERAEVIRKLLDGAVKEWKVKKALEKLRDGKVTFRTAAKLAGLTYVQMLDQAEQANIPLEYSMKDLEADLVKLKGKK